MENDIEYWRCLAGALQRQRNAAQDQVAELQAALARSNQMAREMEEERGALRGSASDAGPNL